MKRSHSHLAVGLTLLVAALAGCSDADDPGIERPDAAQTDVGPDAGGAPDTGSIDACVPSTCAELGCGMHPDGCGGTLSCTEGCDCTPDDFETACPERPCETLAGCEAGRCTYAPVTCGATCAPSTCTGDDCGLLCTEAGCDQGLYPCGGGTCAGVSQYCDPAPTSVGGVLSYQNRCVAPPTDGCGTCELGRRSCDDAQDRFTCADISVPVSAEGGIVECDSSVAGSTFIYVDNQFAGANSDGSRAAPYRTYDDALAAAVSRRSRGIVIAGSPVFTTPMVVEDGVSVYGGFGAGPRFDPDSDARPVWRVGSDHYDRTANRLVGAVARSITRGTVLSRLRIETTDIPTLAEGGRGATNVALLARSAGGLSLEDVELSAGAAGAGSTGDDGAAPTAALDGRRATGRTPGLPGPSCASITCTLQASARIARQDSNQCGHGAFGAAPGFQWFAPNRGNPGSANGQVAGGTAGTNSGNPSAGCNSSRDDTTAGGPGANGAAGSDGGNGTAGSRGELSAEGVWRTGDGTNGQPGAAGTFGGGGGAGGGLYDSCFNDPRYGGHGGGGGGPGCGGDFGRGGGGGGASIGLAASGSAGITLERTTIRAGAGGDGGGAGAGSAGGAGGGGETNVQAICIPTENGAEGQTCNRTGGRGGDGGRGGRGGAGGGGAGGDSVAVYCVGEGIDLTGTDLGAGRPGRAGVASISALTGAAGEALESRGCDG